MIGWSTGTLVVEPPWIDVLSAWLSAGAGSGDELRNLDMLVLDRFVIRK